MFILIEPPQMAHNESQILKHVQYIYHNDAALSFFPSTVVSEAAPAKNTPQIFSPENGWKREMTCSNSIPFQMQCSSHHNVKKQMTESSTTFFRTPATNRWLAHKSTHFKQKTYFLLKKCETTWGLGYHHHHHHHHHHPCQL